MRGDRYAMVAVRQKGTSVYDRPASACRVVGGPTIRVRCAAGGYEDRHG